MEVKLKKNIFQIALPIFVELLFFMLLGTVDTLMLSNYSDDAVGAVVNANTIINLFTVLLTVVATGIVVTLTKILGSKDKDSEAKVVWTGLTFNICLGVVIALILFLLGPVLLVIMKTNSDVIDNSKTYLQIISFGFIGLGISQACGAIFRSYGKPLVIMTVAVISNIINIFMNYMLIYGKFGFDEYGATGAAIGTLTSNIIAAILALICIRVILKYDIKSFVFSKKHLKDIFKIGVPSAFEHFLYNMSQFCIMITVNMILINNMEGIAAISRAYVVMILNYVLLCSLSFANANQIITGYYIGEKDYLTAKQFTIRNFKYAVIVALSVVLLLNFIWKDIFKLLTDDPLVIESLEGVFIVAFFLEIGRASNVVFIAALRTVNDIIFPVILGVISMYGIAVLLSYILAIHCNLGILGVFIAQTLDELFRGTFMFFRWKRKDFEQLNLESI